MNVEVEGSDVYDEKEARDGGSLRGTNIYCSVGVGAAFEDQTARPFGEECEDPADDVCWGVVF